MIKLPENPYNKSTFIFDGSKEYWNKYPEFQVWQDCQQATLKWVIEWLDEECGHLPPKPTQRWNCGACRDELKKFIV